MQIREETKSDAPAIRAVVTEAMTGLAQSTGTEAAIIARLRAENALALSLVAEEGGTVLGYLAASHAQIEAVPGWGRARLNACWRCPLMAARPRAK